MTDELTSTEYDLYTGRRRTMTVRVGDRVRVRTWGGGIVTGTCTGVHDVIKNDQPGIDYTCLLYTSDAADE